MSSLENLMRIRRRLKEWAITFLLKIWDRRRGNASLVMLVIGLPKENLFPKSQRHTSIQCARTIFGNISNFLSRCFLGLFSVDIFYIFSPLCRLNSDWCLHFTDGRGWISVEGSCKYDCQSTL